MQRTMKCYKETTPSLCPVSTLDATYSSSLQDGVEDIFHIQLDNADQLQIYWKPFFMNESSINVNLSLMALKRRLTCNLTMLTTSRYIAQGRQYHPKHLR